MTYNSPLLQNPTSIGLQFGKDLRAEYLAYIEGLTEAFTAASNIKVPVIPITLYNYSDNGGRLSDTAGKEIEHHLHDYANMIAVLTGVQKPTIVYDNTEAQSWTTASFDTAQTTRFSLLGAGNVSFLNCAPRLDETGESKDDVRAGLERTKLTSFTDNFKGDNKGEPVYVAMLPNGHLVSANSRYNFAYFRDMVENGTLEIFEANVQPNGTQFRSRDIFTLHHVMMAHKGTEHLIDWIRIETAYHKSGEDPRINLDQRREFLKSLGYINMNKKLTLEEIPKLGQFTIANMDVHGNIKTNTRLSELSPDARQILDKGPVSVIIEGKTFIGIFTEKMFDRTIAEKTPDGISRKEGVAIGSSGQNWQGADNKDGFLEVSILHGDAAEFFELTTKKLRKPVRIKIDGILERDIAPPGAAPHLAAVPDLAAQAPHV